MSSGLSVKAISNLGFNSNDINIEIIITNTYLNEKTKHAFLEKKVTFVIFGLILTNSDHNSPFHAHNRLLSIH